MAVPSLSYWLLFISAYNYIGASVLAYKPESLEHLFVDSGTVLANNETTVFILRRVIVWWILTAFSSHHRGMYLYSLWSFLIWLSWSCSEAFYFHRVPSYTFLFGMGVGTTSTMWMLLYLPIMWSITANATFKTYKLPIK